MEQDLWKARKKRIFDKIVKISKITSVQGEITRQTFSRAWEVGIRTIAEEMEHLNMRVRMDGIGNLIGSYDPGKTGKKPIGIGSHLDTVINGGAYDGTAGIVVGLEIIRMLEERKLTLSRPIEVIAFAEEEGGVFGKGCMGSEYLTGNTPLKCLNQFHDCSGRTPEQAANAVNFPKKAYGSDYGWGKAYYHSFFEIHVEQGGKLQEEKKRIGIVDGVVGILRSEVTFTGQRNHAGTTEMARRKDALVALSEFILQTYEYGQENNGRLVVTNGKLNVFPNQHNVVPGKAISTMEMRAQTDEQIRRAYLELKSRAETIAEKYQIEVNFSDPVYVKPAYFDKNLLRMADKTAELTDNTMHLFSWAGHDGKLMSKVTPSLMIFVPSKDGMSHCPEEYSDAGDLAAVSEFVFCMIKEIINAFDKKRPGTPD